MVSRVACCGRERFGLGSYRGEVHRMCFAWVRYWRDEFASGEIDLLFRCWDRWYLPFLCKCLAISKRYYLLVSSAVFGNSQVIVLLFANWAISCTYGGGQLRQEIHGSSRWNQINNETCTVRNIVARG